MRSSLNSLSSTSVSSATAMVVKVVVIGALLLGATACAGGVSGTPAVGTAVPTPTTTAAPTRTSSSPTTEIDDTTTASTVDTTLASGVTIEELVDDIGFAEQIVDEYWATHWAEFFTGTYQSPTIRGLYDGTVAADTPTCDGEPLDAYNAQYCVPEDYVAYDAGLLLDGADLIGDSWVYLVVAHEWGHAVQARLDPSLVAAADELQADCLGAAALFGAAADGRLQLEEGDERELISSLNQLADEMPWTMSADHGDPFQRVEWFTLGRNGGVQACIDAAATPEGQSAAPTS